MDLRVLAPGYAGPFGKVKTEEENIRAPCKVLDSLTADTAFITVLHAPKPFFW